VVNEKIYNPDMRIKAKILKSTIKDIVMKYNINLD